VTKNQTTNPTPGETGAAVVVDDVAEPNVPAQTIPAQEPVPAAEKPQPERAPAPVKPEPSERTFTQADVDQMIKERLQRERGKFADYETLRTAAGELEAVKAELAKLKGQAESASGEAARLRVETAIVSAAAKLGFTDPLDAVRLVDISKLPADDAAGGLDAALRSLAETKPYLVRRNAPALSPANPSRETAQPIGRSDAERRAEYFGGGASSFWDGRGSSISTKTEE
jgi:hypothetical protein